MKSDSALRTTSLPPYEIAESDLRYIDPKEVEVEVEPDWKQRAHELSQRLCASEEGGERNALLKEAGEVWAGVKPALARASSNKCWYCETKQSRAENDVDHFRPKNRVRSCAGHPGYFWLAADVYNFRLSCQFCNRPGSDRTREPAGGKADHFPLVDEATRCFGPEDDIELEDVVLLDPTVVADVQLLWVNEYGQCLPHPHRAAPEPDADTRVRISIQLLNLDEVRLVEERLRLSQRVRSAVRSAEECWARGDRVSYERHVGELITLARGSSEYSLAARCQLRALDVGEGSVARTVLQEI